MNWLTDLVSANAVLFGWLGAVSLFLLCLTVFFTPWLIAQLPHDYFLKRAMPAVTPDNQSAGEQTSAVSSIAKLVWVTGIKLLRNVLGVLIILTGLLMMLTPGPGLVTLVLGLSVCDFSAKQRLLSQTVNQPKVFLALNWMRRRHGKTAFPPIPKMTELSLWRRTIPPLSTWLHYT